MSVSPSTQLGYDVAMHYPVPAEQVSNLLEIKKSKFIAYASFADSREMAMASLVTLRKKYPDARHHCWAYLLGNPHSPASVAMSDDGEPSGTAGKPILNVLQHTNIGNIMVVVVRYFGGIKLGAGGLVRAYSSATQQVIESLPTRKETPMYVVTWHADFKHEQFIRHFVSTQNGTIETCYYTNGAQITAKLPEKGVSELETTFGAMPIRFKVS